MCSETLTKWGLVIINIAFFLVGGVVLGLGIWIHVDEASFSLYGGTILQNVPIFTSGLSLFKTASLALILIGAISFVPALFGCCGACLKIRLFLIVYVIILGVFLLAELAFVVAVAVKQDEVKGFVRNLANDSLTTYKDGLRFNASLYPDVKIELPSTAMELAWDTVHIELECCGIAGPADFRRDAPQFNQKFEIAQIFHLYAEVPLSCCSLDDKTKFPAEISKIEFKFKKDVASCLNQTAASVTNQKGCEAALQAWVSDQFVKIIIAGVVVILLELVGMICAMKLFRSVSGDQEKA